MATSGTNTFDLDVDQLIEEAFERCGINSRSGYDLKSARRSLNIMLAEWANRGLNQWTIEQTTQTVTEGTTNYSLNSNVIDILDMVIRRTVNTTQTDISLSRLSRSQYINIPNKTTKARPSQFFFDKLTTPVIKIWPAPENSTDILVFNKLVRMDDADKATNTMDMPFRFYPCFAAGLAYYISMKRSPERSAMLKQAYEEEFERAMSQDEDRASFRIRPYLSV